jgi:hypothetical protein
MSPSENQDRLADPRGSDRLLAIAIGIIALAAIPAAVVWITTRMVPAPGAPLSAFPEGSFPAQGLTLGEYRREMEARLHGLGWIDRDKGVAHVPIELGMQLMLAHKLPARDAAPVEGKKQ